MTRAWLLAFALLAGALAGCPGELADRDSYPEDPILCPDGYDMESVLMSDRCSTSACHGGESPQAGLDLSRPGVFARLLDQESSQWGDTCGVAEGDTSPAPLLLIDGDQPESSFVLQKLLGVPSDGSCGDQMPFSDTFTGREYSCFRRWIYENLGQLDGGVGDAGAGDAGALDAGALDAGDPDGGADDAGVEDGGADASTEDGGADAAALDGGS